MKSDVWTNFVQTSDFTVKALMISNSLYDRNFQKRTDIKEKFASMLNFARRTRF